jgi:hypothetical protein
MCAREIVVSSPDSIPAEIRRFTLNELFDIGVSVMVLRDPKAALLDVWLSGLEKSTRPSTWPDLLRLPIEEQARYADVPAKYAPYTIEGFIVKQYGGLPQLSRCDPRVINETALANTASLTLAAANRNILAREWSDFYQATVNKLKRHYGVAE